MSARSLKGRERSPNASWACTATACAVLSMLLTMSDLAAASDQECDSWPAWRLFKELYVSDDGRVIDASSPRQATVSEAQAYGLFFALVGNDPQTFSTMLQWTSNNLAQGDLGPVLPAWIWGRADDGTWQVLDSNAASDADLWLAYTLVEAGRLWNEASYVTLGRVLASTILREEVASLPGLGATLLPGPHGFADKQLWRLNPSYVPLQVIQGVSRHSREPVWSELVRTSEQMIMGSAPRGFAADWVEYRTGKGFIIDRETGGVGSYNAIRVYLWAGMLPPSDPARARLARHLAPIVTLARGSALPEHVDTNTLRTTGQGPAGFSAALLPMLRNAEFREAERVHRARVESELLRSDQAYYSDALSLFGLGWLEGRYRFGSSGFLNVGWRQPCKSARA